MDEHSFMRDTVLTSLALGWMHNDALTLKRYSAACYFHARADWTDETLEALPPIILFAPSLSIVGKATLTPGSASPMIYLCPTLEFETVKHVNFTFAHEVAHIALGHHVIGNEEMESGIGLQWRDRPAEKSADALAQKWGFKEPRKSRRLDRLAVFGSSMLSVREAKKVQERMDQEENAEAHRPFGRRRCC